MLKDNKPLRSAGQATASFQPKPWSTPGTVTDTVTGVIFRNTPWWWWVAFVVSLGLLGLYILMFLSITIRGTYLWGINVPVVWGMGIVNLIFWIGIGHAGTFISAFLLLMRQHWRGAFSRFAEAMTLFAVTVAGLFPLLHLGRIELAYFILPYPNTMVLHPQFRSPLAWDSIAIATYGIVSLIFWYIDLIPDLGAMRDKAQRTWVKRAYGAAAMGWRGESRHWSALHRTAYMLAAIATPLVISVHSVIGLDFAVAQVPGWHHTIFPPFFVAGAIFSGLAMVLIFAVIFRSGFQLNGLITDRHIDHAAKLMLVTGLIVTYGYLIENFAAWFSDHDYEVALAIERALGNYAPLYWGMIICNAVLIQALWFKRVRRNNTALVIISVFVLIGMWLERFVIVPVSLSFPYLETSWITFQWTIWDILTVVAPFGLFLVPMLLFMRLLPLLPMHETQQVAVEEGGIHE